MKITVLYNPELKNYDFGPGHSFRSDRFASFLKLYHETLAGDPHFQLVNHNELASDEELGLWHTQDYINMMKAASQAVNDDYEEVDWPFLGYANLAAWGPKVGPSRQSLSVYLSRDNVNPSTSRIPEGIEKAATAVVKNSILAADYVQQGKATKAISIGGGLHHAKAGYGEGFCIYNDVVIAARYAMKKYGLERILILDTDAHAGNGTCEAFYADPRVLFIDLHQGGIYPGTGLVEEVGEGEGKGSTINIPLESGTGDALYEKIFDEIVFPLAGEFQPQLIIRNGGSDPHFADSLSGLGLTLAGFRMIGDKVRQLSAEICDGKSVDLICSGYNQDVLAKAWLSLIAGLSGREIELTESVSHLGNQNLIETEKLIGKVKTILKPYWESMQYL